MKLLLNGTMNEVILEGVVGSTAYGLNHAKSDIDKKGIFAFNTSDLFGLRYNQLKDVVETNSLISDITYYEAAKWCNLALKCNPNILELVFLTNDLYTARSDLGNALIDIRSAFLSQSAVKSSYINYARSQLHEIEQDGKFKKRPVAKVEKHARHLVRLMMQGYELYTTGGLTVRLTPDTVVQVRAVAYMAGLGDLGPLRAVYDNYHDGFETSVSALPYEPDVEAVEGWLQHVRQRLLK